MLSGAVGTAPLICLLLHALAEDMLT